MNIGYSSNQYPNLRNIVGRVRGAKYLKLYDPGQMFRRLRRPLKRFVRSKANATDCVMEFDGVGLGTVDIIHLFNSVSVTKDPWITTFESVVPRVMCAGGYKTFREDVRRNVVRLSRPNCKRLIALSECAVQRQIDFLNDFPEMADEILPKVVCLHPPQAIVVESFDAKEVNFEKGIHFMFVGSAFFRKGGREILNAFKSVRDDGWEDFRLTIVSSLNIDNYATGETEEDVVLA